MPTTTSDPWDFRNFLPAGVIPFKVSESFAFPSDHSQAQDGWRTFDGQSLLGHLKTHGDDSICHQLELLVKHKYIRSTSIHRETHVLCRVYLVPFDLPNVQGCLRLRANNTQIRDSLQNVLAHIRTNRSLWEGHLEDADGHSGLFFPNPCDTRTLSEIYSEIPSPSSYQLSPNSSPMISRLLDPDNPLVELGLRSTLYSYQRQSVAAMIDQETSQQDIPDPCYIPITGIDNRDFFIQPGTLEILHEQPRVSSAKGGLLCEELGTGKTVMILSLILHNLREISEPEPSIFDPRPILTPVSFAHFPGSPFAQARKSVRPILPSPTRVPTLTELLVHHYRLHSHLDTATLEETEKKLAGTDFPRLIRATQPFYYAHPPSHTSEPQRSRLKARSLNPKKLILTSASLIVVPRMILEQWYKEIQKHIRLDIRVLRLGVKDRVPCVQNLASDYDIILTSYDRFRTEGNFVDSNKLDSAKPCKCPPFPNTRIPNCSCDIPGVTPFLQIRWKRLIIDEGHVSGMLNSVSINFANSLSVQHRWIVTGTPTTNLLGLNFGSYSETSVDDLSDNGSDVDMDMLFTPSDDDAIEAPRRIWDKQDSEDIKKLGHMISSFIGVPQFAVNHNLMRTHVRNPLMHKLGPKPGSIQVLSQIMSTIMVRHRVEDVEKDVLLPPIRHDRVFLDLDPYAALSYNMFVAGIVVNAVDSERKGQDYFFHPTQAEFLKATVQNMSQMLFWRIDDELYNSEAILAERENHVQRAKERNVNEDDQILLQQAMSHVEKAYSNKLWKDMQFHEDVPYRTTGFNSVPDIFNAWSRLSSGGSKEGFIHPDRLVKLRERLIKNPLISLENLRTIGHTQARFDERRRDFEQRNAKKTSGRKKSSEGQKSTLNDAKTNAGNNRTKVANTLEEMRRELDLALKRLEELGGGKSDTRTPLTTQRDPPLICRSILAEARIGKSASSKLDWILREILNHSADEKILIFSDSDLTLAHVAEALELHRIRHVQFVSKVDPQTRQQVVLTFETSDTYRVFLMSLKHGARGLNVVSASRVIFCEPVWQPDVESQAIKRVHRIGQTKPVTVTTLAIRGTAEEAIVERRSSLLDKQGRPPRLLEEAGMRHFIAHPKFLEPAESSPVVIDIPLFNLKNPRVTLNGQERMDISPSEEAGMQDGPASDVNSRDRGVSIDSPSQGTPGDPIPTLDYCSSHPVKMRKRVRFSS